MHFYNLKENHIFFGISPILYIIYTYFLYLVLNLFINFLKLSQATFEKTLTIIQ